MANVLRSGWFNPVHMKSREAHAVRALLSSRKTVKRKCIALANEIRGLFRIFGLRLPPRIEQASFDEKVSHLGPTRHQRLDGLLQQTATPFRA